ncbi:MAG: hypothetical protein RDV48_00980 [Candidatus Eremiobacteraeota bacterium]|nr:hypothetical protein [Candidatus Eremiobacteraeota bacterium]
MKKSTRLPLCLMMCGFVLIVVLTGVLDSGAAAAGDPGKSGPEDLLIAQRMSRSTTACSVYKFKASELYAVPSSTQPAFLKFENSWSDLPDELIPGQPFNIRLAVDML